MPKRARAGTPDGWTIDGIRKRANQLTQADGRKQAAWQLANEAPDARYWTALHSFDEQYALLYGPLGEAITQLRADDQGDVEILVRFLEADVYCFHSGYMKAESIRALLGAHMTSGVADRLRNVVLAVIQAYDRQEFRSYVRLARRLDSADLRLRLRALAASPSSATARRAGWVLAGIEGQPATR